MNNAVYHSHFDTVIGVYLWRHCGLDIDTKTSELIGVMAHTECDYFAAAEYPRMYLGAMAVERVGNASVNYRTALFALDEEKVKDRRVLVDPFNGHWPDEE